MIKIRRFNNTIKRYMRILKTCGRYKSNYLLQKYYFFLGKCFYLTGNFKINNVNNPFFLWRFKKPTFNNKIRSVKFIKILLMRHKPLKRFKIKNNKPGLSFGVRVALFKRRKKWSIPNVLYPFNETMVNKLHMPINLVRPNITNKFFIRMLTSYGETYYIQGPIQINFFKIYHSYLQPIKQFSLIKNFYNYIHAYPVLTKLSNITLNFSYKLQLAVAKGSFAKILYHKKENKTVCVLLPSKKKIFLNSLMVAFYAYINNDYLKYKTKINKHSYYKYSGYKTIVRGVAKNPVDHPNGGNTKAKIKYKTPWGKLTK